MPNARHIELYDDVEKIPFDKLAESSPTASGYALRAVAADQRDCPPHSSVRRRERQAEYPRTGDAGQAKAGTAETNPRLAACCSSRCDATSHAVSELRIGGSADVMLSV